MDVASKDSLFAAVAYNYRTLTPETVTARYEIYVIVEATVRNFDRVLLVDIDAQSYATVADYLRSCFNNFGPGLRMMFNAALLACDADANESVLRTATGKTASTLSYRFVARSRHSACHITDLIPSRCEDREPDIRPTVEFRRITVFTFVASEVLVPLPISLPRPPCSTATSAALYSDSGMQTTSLFLTSPQSTHVPFSASSHSSSTPHSSSI